LKRFHVFRDIAWLVHLLLQIILSEFRIADSVAWARWIEVLHLTWSRSGYDYSNTRIDMI